MHLLVIFRQKDIIFERNSIFFCFWLFEKSYKMAQIVRKILSLD